MDIMRQSACLVVNPITIYNYGFLFYCTTQDGTGLCFCPEFGVSVRSTELDQVNPGSAGS